MSILADGEQWRVIGGDCLRELAALPDECADAVVCDPPYGMSYQSARRIDKTSWFDPIANDDRPFIWWLWDSFRITKDGGALLCFCRWDSAEAFRLAIEWAGFTIGGQVIWDRIGHGMGDLNGQPAPRHDTIWFAKKGKFEWRGPRLKSVVSHQRISGEALTHPNEKPVPLMIELVTSICPENGLVVDPCCGSGSTGVACSHTNRRFLGMELDGGMALIARRRISEAAPLFVRPPEPDPELFGAKP